MLSRCELWAGVGLLICVFQLLVVVGVARRFFFRMGCVLWFVVVMSGSECVRLFTFSLDDAFCSCSLSCVDLCKH